MNTRHVALLAVAMLTLSACTPSVDQATRINTDPFAFPGSAPAVDAAQSHPEADAAQSAQIDADGRIPLPPVPSLPSASGVLALVVDEEAAIPQVLLDDFTDATGVTVDARTMTKDAGQVAVDVLIGFDGATLADSHKAGVLADEAPHGITAQHPVQGIPAAVDYARDDVCVIADEQWYTLNKAQVPASLSALSAAEVAQQMVLAPQDSSVSRAFEDFATQTLGNQAATWLSQLKSAALTPASWHEAARASTIRVHQEQGAREVPGRTRWAGGELATAASSDTEQGSRPLRVAPVSVAARATTNTQTSGYATVIQGSCAERYVYVAPAQQANNPAAAEAFTAYVTSDRAQRILALTGAAIPRNTGMIPGSVIDWYAHD